MRGAAKGREWKGEVNGEEGKEGGKERDREECLGRAREMCEA